MPFGYAPTFIIIVGFTLVGFALEIATNGNGFPKPIAPVNIFLILMYLVFLTIVYFIKPLRKLINWFSSITLAVTQFMAIHHLRCTVSKRSAV